MRTALALLKHEPKTRPFFAALAQSSLGTGAAYVGLLLVAYERFRSPWAISLILLADFLPSMLLGPMVGAAADRWSRRWCVVVADLARAVAFVGIALVGSFEATVLLALLAGVGTALFKPAALAGLPSLVSSERAAATTSLYGAVTDAGWTVGPAVAAAGLLVTSAEELMLLNGITFAISAAVLVRLPLDRRRTQAPSGEEPSSPSGEEPSSQTSLFREGLEGWRAVAAMVDIRIVIIASTAAMFFGGVFNVAELLFADESLGAGDSGYSVLVTLYGLGFVIGSLAGSGGGDAPLLRRRFVQGLAITGIGSLTTALSPNLGVALMTFTLGGFGNGLLIVYLRLLIQSRVPEGVQGRAFGLSDSLVSWAFAVAFFSAGASASALGPRTLILAVGIGEVVTAAITFAALKQRRAIAPGRLSLALRSSRT